MAADTPTSVQNASPVTDDTMYRWYKCTQKMHTRWNCELLKTLDNIQNEYSTTTIPICKYIPSAFDNMILTHKLNKVDLLPDNKKI